MAAFVSFMKSLKWCLVVIKAIIDESGPHILHNLLVLWSKMSENNENMHCRFPA